MISPIVFYGKYRQDKCLQFRGNFDKYNEIRLINCSLWTEYLIYIADNKETLIPVDPCNYLAGYPLATTQGMFECVGVYIGW